MMTKTAELFPGPFDLLPPIFRDCVDPEWTSRRGLCVAFPQPVGPYVVATDARICVRMLATPEILETLPDISPKKFPAKTVESIIGDRGIYEPEPTPLPSLGHLDRCNECKGKGHRLKRRCSGACGDFDDEPPCHGKGIIPAGPCWSCDGTGIHRASFEFLELRKDVKLSVVYLHLLTKHGATIYLPVEPNTHESTTPVYFTTEGGVEGVLMPAAVDKPEKAKVAEGVPA